MKSIYKVGFTVATSLSILFSSTTPVAAASLSEQVAQQKSEVNKLQEELTALKNDVTAINDKMSANQAEIEKKEKNIAELEKSIEKRVEILKERATALQQQNRTNIVVDVILHAESITDLVSSMSSVGTIFQSDTDILDKIAEEKAQIVDEKAAIVEKQAELEKQETEKKTALAALDTKLVTAMNTLAVSERELEKQLATAAAFIADNSESNAPSTANNGSNSSSTTTAPPTSNASGVVGIGLSYQGVPYVFGGKSPSGFDCSGFISYVFNQAGRGIGYQTAARYYNSATKVSTPQPGDLVFFANTYMPGISHVGIYIGGGNMVHASSSRGITVQSINSSYWQGKFAGFGRL